MSGNKEKLISGLHLLQAFGFKPSQKEVIVALCRSMGMTEQEFCKEAVLEHVRVLLDNPDRIGEAVRAMLERKYRKIT